MVKSINMLITVFLTIFMWLNVHGKEDKPTPHTQYANEATAIFLKEMYRNYGLECGWSGGQMPYDVEEISVGLIAYQSATITQARELEVKTTERLVQIINAHEKIRPFLREYPFTSNRARVAISFRKIESVAYDDKNNISFVCHAKNKLYYLAHDPENPYVGKDVKNEPYEEALRIVQKSKPDLAR